MLNTLKTIEKVTAALRTLATAKSDKALIGLLEAEGVKGVPYRQGECPLANYLNKKAGKGAKITVDSDEVIVRVGDAANIILGTAIAFSLPLTPAMHEFVDQIDLQDDEAGRFQSPEVRAKAAKKFAGVTKKKKKA